jgi:hypothetical protein
MSFPEYTNGTILFVNGSIPITHEKYIRPQDNGKKSFYGGFIMQPTHIYQSIIPHTWPHFFKKANCKLTTN